MTKPRSRTASAKTAPPKRSRKHRARPTPKWLKDKQDLDEMAKRRCLLILNVLSGQRAVTEVIEEAQISRQMYYQLEERALRAMLTSLTPGASEPGAPEPSRRIAELERKVAQLEQEKRRGERLLLLTRKVMKGSLKMAPGRPPRSPASSSSTSGGPRRSRASSKKTTPSTSASPSTPTTGGEAAS
jgi:polyhydroxyalkanoate synthesis regulator phasin